MPLEWTLQQLIATANSLVQCITYEAMAPTLSVYHDITDLDEATLK